MTLTTALVIMLVVGLPLMLLAGGVLANVYVMTRRQPTAPALDPTDVALRAMATESADDLVVELQRSIEDLKGQMAGQRRTLEGLLSRPAAAPAVAMASAGAAPAPAPARVPSNLDLAVNELLAEGLSDRAIARRLQVGLEEVSMARALRGRP